MFKIKFCGITRIEDAVAAYEAGADAIGLNFCKTSPRYVSSELARGIVDANDGKMAIVGVFVNASIDEISRAVQAFKLDYVQLHGEEHPDNFSGQSLPPIIRSLTWLGPQSAGTATSWLGQNLAAFLVDAHDPVARGGTGKVANWDLLVPRPHPLNEVPLLLAGGLTAANVALGIQKVRPLGVDTASGIEEAPGIKSAIKMKAFVEAVRSTGILT